MDAGRDDTVEVWRVSLAGGADGLARLLDDDERAIAERFHFERDRLRYLRAHAALRMLLGQRLGIEPAALRFDRGPHGKPSLRPAGALRFNLSHSGELALVALAVGRELGVDVEERLPLPELSAIAETHFSPHERAQLAALPVHQQLHAFYACWSRKEAFIKATGEGLSMPLDSFDVSLVPGQPAQLLATRPDGALARGFRLVNLDLGERYAGALVAAGPEPRVVLRELALPAAP